MDPKATGHIRVKRFDEFLRKLQSVKSPLLSKAILKQKVDPLSEEAMEK